MQLWEILFVGCLNMVSALDTSCNNIAAPSAAHLATQLTVHYRVTTGPSVSFNIIEGTVNIASSFTRIFGAARLCWSVSSLALRDITCGARESSYAVAVQI